VGGGGGLSLTNQWLGRLVYKGCDAAYDRPRGGPALLNWRETIKTVGMYDIQCECGKVHTGHIG
jgi:hypothetical protein